jgi:hypothetical protein
LITLKAYELNQEKQPSLRNRHTSWDYFRQLINERLTLNIYLKTEEDIEAAVKLLNNRTQWAGWNATPEHTDTLNEYDCPILIKQKIQEERRLRRVWHRLQTPRAKDYLMQQNRNSNNSSITKKIITSKQSYKVLHQKNPMGISCGR